jgi:hypothetical protein
LNIVRPFHRLFQGIVKLAAKDTKDFIIGCLLGFGLAAVVAYLLSWPSRRYLVGVESLLLDQFQQKHPEKYWAGKIYRTVNMICVLVWCLIYSLIFLTFLGNSDAMPFIFPITFFTFVIAANAISTGVFEVVTQVSCTGHKIRWHYGDINKQFGRPIKYFYGKEVRQAGKSRLLLGIVVLLVNLVILFVASNVNLY